MSENAQEDANYWDGDRPKGTRHAGAGGGDRVGQARRWYERNKCRRREYMRGYMAMRRNKQLKEAI